MTNGQTPEPVSTPEQVMEHLARRAVQTAKGVEELKARHDDLLEALKEARALIVNLFTDMRLHPDAIPANAIVRRIDSAIAAATGRGT